MMRLGRLISVLLIRRSKSSPPLIGLVSDVDPAIVAAQMPWTSGWPSDSFCGGHGLAASAGFAPPPLPCPATAAVIDSSATPIPNTTNQYFVFIWQLLNRDTE